MESSATVAAVAGAAGAAAMLLLVAVVLLATRRRRSHSDLAAQLEQARRETDDLRHRLDELTRSVAAPPAVARPEPADYVITHVGEPDDLDPVAVPDRLVLSATVGVPLVKAAAFSHGVRRALSAESRNRIWFEVRREVRASRRRRRQLRKHLEREYRARLRGTDDPFVEGPVVETPA
jgi:MYXO-CTERM domain-containing protein